MGAADRRGGDGCASYSTDRRRGDRGRAHDRPARGRVLPREADRPDGGGGARVHPHDRRDGRHDPRDRHGLPAEGDRGRGVPVPAHGGPRREGRGGRQQVRHEGRALDQLPEDRRGGRAGAGRARPTLQGVAAHGQGGEAIETARRRVPRESKRHAGPHRGREGLCQPRRDLGRVPAGLWAVPRADHFLGARRPMSEPIRITRAATKKPKPRDSELTFGTVFTDHVFVMDFQEEKGWYDPRIEPYGPLSLDPAAAVLHYAQAVFDGLKAFRGKDGRVRLFRPQKHVERLNQSARRLCIPPLDPELAIKALVELVGLEKDWVPSTVGTSLYIRPTIIANEPFLGVRPAKSYIYYVILSPVGTYYPEGMNPVKILVVDKYVRAVEGGVGGAKTGVNYAASLYAAEEAKHAGFTQVLWLDGRERKYIDEVGTMNIMLRIGDEVVTPPLSQGTILPGVTRDSVLTLTREWGLRVSERAISIDDVARAAHGGSLREVWGTGTAAVISPVGELAYAGERIVINGGKIGELTQKLYDAIVGIQYATAPDTHGWTVLV